jgi:hypothetical protein
MPYWPSTIDYLRRDRSGPASAEDCDVASDLWRRRLKPRLYVLAGVIGWLALGCEGQMPAVRGRVVGSHGAGDVLVYTLPRMEVQCAVSGRYTTRRLGGVAGGGGAVAYVWRQDTNGIAQVVRIDLEAGLESVIGTGSFPAVTSDGHFVVWLAPADAMAESVAIVRMNLQGQERADTIAYYVNVWQGVWWGPCAGLVPMDGTWIAYNGPGGEIWRVDVEHGLRNRIGGRGLIPEFWQAAAGGIVCWEGPSSTQGRTVLLGVDGRVRSLPQLRGLSGYAPSAGGPLAVVVVTGPPRLMRDSYRVAVFGWRTGTLKRIADGPFFLERGVWLVGD